MIDKDLADQLPSCLRCGQPITETLPEGWHGWCPVCREGWLRWWRDRNAVP